MKPTLQCVFLVISGVFLACNKKPLATPNMTWPPLSEFPAVSGRAATAEDVSAGRAVFVLQDSGNPIGEPISMPVPQYALHRDEQSGKQTPCVIIQAEHARGQRVVGACMLPDRSIMAGLFPEFELLGTTPQSTGK